VIEGIVAIEMIGSEVEQRGRARMECLHVLELVGADFNHQHSFRGDGLDLLGQGPAHVAHHRRRFPKASTS
jgi:hypothetical protein